MSGSCNALWPLVVLLACSAPPKTGARTEPAKVPLALADAGIPDAAPPPPPPRYLSSTASSEPKGVVAARLFAFADTQLHHLYGKRTFAQSPFADRMAFEVAIRPAALDDGSDLLLAAVASDYAHHYADHELLFLGDAADLSCEPELDSFLQVFADAGVRQLHAVTSNHDGFFVGNFTSKDDLDGNLALTDMPHDWTRACSTPNSFFDNRLTKGRAVKKLSELVPQGPLWASSVAYRGALGPDDYKSSWMYYVRQLGGGSVGAPPVWGVFLDTVDYRGFDLKSAQGAGSAGAISRLQLRFLDRAMFEASGTVPGQKPVFVVFGHHPMNSLEPDSRRRLQQFFAAHPDVLGYVAAHEHATGERTIYANGRMVPELVIGSTTDAPNSATRIEVRIDGGKPRLVHEHLRLDRSLCDGIAPMPPTSLGYTGYRIGRDDTPDVDIGFLDKVAFAIGASDLEDQRIRQVIGALLVENELVRSLAELYLSAPIALTERERAVLRAIRVTRYAAGNGRAALDPYLRGKVAPYEQLSRYERWDDPVVAKVVGSAAQGLHRFGPHAALFQSLRKRREYSPETHRYFLCHAAFAAEAEARLPKRRGNVLYIR